MYHQINPTEVFCERQLALLEEAQNRRLGRRLRRAGYDSPPPGMNRERAG
jgi:hypothetical protein